MLQHSKPQLRFVWEYHPSDNTVLMNKSLEVTSVEQRREDTARQTLQQISESEHEYERFLREQTHQLKKLFQSIKVQPRIHR